TGRIRIEAAKELRRLLHGYYEDLWAASEDPSRKVAWLSSVGPTELARAYGFQVYYPENHGALLGATRTAARYIPKAVAQGYSPDICAYLTADIGAHISGTTPLTDAYGLPGIPKPDVLIYSTNQCRDVCDWWNYYGREFDVPVIGVHPPSMLDEVDDRHLRAVAAEHEMVQEKLAKISGRTLVPDHLKEIISNARRAAVLWREVLDLARHKPAPITFFDGVIHMAPIVLMRGTTEAVDYYELLKAELSARIDNNVAAVPGERLRLYWEGMPIWGALRELSTLFFDLKTSLVASTYCNTWAFDGLDPDCIDQSMARAYTELFINRTDDVKLSILKKIVTDFSVDGVIFHDSKTCPNNTNCHYGMPERLAAECGIPSVVISGDMVDSRLYSPDQVRTTIEGFIEQLSGF
ncbi:MAG: 2-hydroxyacyl-CoA dehydratase family protein, partial [Candidatus Obscuribacterales bacterium]|nr:2-hydroxyacyl-CoA dehydratase family protein [Candidatus Obscuribacterales bacterium]